MDKLFSKNTSLRLVVVFALFLLGSFSLLLDKVTGNVLYKGKSKTFDVAIKYVYLVEGPDNLNPSERIQRLIFSAKDIGDKIKASTLMRDTDKDLTEGFEINLVKGPRYEYWMVLNGGLVQYSGTVPPTNLVTKTQSPTQIAGTFKQDNSGAGGPKIDVTFEVTLLKKFDK